MNRPYSEAAVEVVAAVTDAWETRPRGRNHDPSRCLSCRGNAMLVLDALAAAGLLLLEGAETRTEWGTRITWDDGAVEDSACPSEAFARRRVAMHAEKRAHRPGWRAAAELISREIRTGPWAPVDAVRLAVGDSKPTQDPDEVSGV